MQNKTATKITKKMKVQLDAALVLSAFQMLVCNFGGFRGAQCYKDPL
jgi:hypothetical protein